MKKSKHQFDFLENPEFDFAHKEDMKEVSLASVDKDWSPPQVFPDLTKHKRIAVDLETKDPNIKTLGPGWPRRDGYVIGIAVAAGDYQGYFPFRHAEGENLPEDIVLSWFKKQMATPDIEKVFHNSTYDLGWLRAEGIEVQGRIIDTMIAAPLLDENRRYYNLNSLAGEYLQEYKNEKLLKQAATYFGVDPKSGMWQLPCRYVGPYAEQDAAVTLRLWNKLSIELKQQQC